jgi:hypothetical protein
LINIGIQVRGLRDQRLAVRAVQLSTGKLRTEQRQQRLFQPEQAGVDADPRRLPGGVGPYLSNGADQPVVAVIHVGAG